MTIVGRTVILALWFFSNSVVAAGLGHAKRPIFASRSWGHLLQDAKAHRAALIDEPTEPFKCPLTKCPAGCKLEKLEQSCLCRCGQGPAASTGMGSAATAPENSAACSGPLLCWWKRSSAVMKVFYICLAAILIYFAATSLSNFIRKMTTKTFNEGDKVLLKPKYHDQYANKTGTIKHQLVDGRYHVMLEDGTDVALVPGSLDLLPETIS
eukprot:CAMPEP_0204276700 /NCGR_PEP_ID=MMETSP0468-20130131/28674_1 /ASSEMBLY_ACC=CAM_ASM_000383 /TAXON_ID=2969 /ORGANISM="Oxyrrhis marina" /LENGTH=209 /DNA_ID=CAMNT_0051253373 /DNA_START=72 /DNA_END=701 /DNA_ORIENTATION=-